MRVGDCTDSHRGKRCAGTTRRQLLQADERRMDVQMHDGRGQNHQAYLWQYGRPGGAWCSTFRLGRARRTQEFLGQFEGILQTDGYVAMMAWRAKIVQCLLLGARAKEVFEQPSSSPNDRWKSARGICSVAGARLDLTADGSLPAWLGPLSKASATLAHCPVDHVDQLWQRMELGCLEEFPSRVPQQQACTDLRPATPIIGT